MNSVDRKCILQSVARPGYHKYSCPFPGCVAAVMEYLGEPIDYEYLMAVSGAAFRRAWRQGDGGNVDFMHFSPLPEEHLFRAIGWSYRVVRHGDKQAMIEAVKDSIRVGRPAFAFGIIGPPECGLVTGYEDYGDTLVGYSFFQDWNTRGYYHESDWYTDGLIMMMVLTGRTEMPTEAQILRDTLQLALSLGREPLLQSSGHVSGIAANLAYADALEDNSNFPLDNDEQMNLQAMLYWDQSTMLDERRHAATYLRQAADKFPAVGPALNAAAQQYEALWSYTAWVARLGYDLALGRIAPGDTRLGNESGRREIAAAYRQAFDCEQKALESVEQALQGLE
jgi:hypothetical protein